MKRSLFAGLATVLLFVLAIFFFTGHAPSGHTPHPIFAYGTLTQPVVRRIVTGRWIETRPATLRGYTQSGLDIRPQADGRVEGVTFRVSDRELARLDRYERVGVRYTRHKLTLQSGQKAWVYRRIRSDGGKHE